MRANRFLSAAVVRIKQVSCCCGPRNAAVRQKPQNRRRAANLRKTLSFLKNRSPALNKVFILFNHVYPFKRVAKAPLSSEAAWYRCCDTKAASHLCVSAPWTKYQFCLLRFFVCVVCVLVLAYSTIVLAILVFEVSVHFAFLFVFRLFFSFFDQWPMTI